MKLFDQIRQVIRRMFGIQDVKRAIRTDVSVSPEMLSAIAEWEQLYSNHPPWESDTVTPLGLPAAVAGELARLVTLELSSEITGSARAEFLNVPYQQLLSHLQERIEHGCALGGMAFKPYPTNGGIGIDCTPADRFLPTAFDGSGNIMGGVFVDRYVEGNRFYTRFEHHGFEDGVYTIRNVAYRSYEDSDIGLQIPLSSVTAWSELSDEVKIQNVSRPLFGYFRVPMANNIDRDSPLGVSVYARAVSLFRQADEQWERLLWEFEATELAIDISASAFPPDGKGGCILPKHQKRMFRPNGLGDVDKPLYQVFSPEIREQPIYSGFNRILQRIEFACGLAYGTLSDPQNVDKTATEINASKQRSYSTVASMQTALQMALDGLVYAMDVWATLGGLAPVGIYEVAYSWDDSIIVDADKEFSNRLLMVQGGYLKPEKFLAWYFGISEEEAAEYLPESEQDDDAVRFE